MRIQQITPSFGQGFPLEWVDWHAGMSRIDAAKMGVHIFRWPGATVEMKRKDTGAYLARRMEEVGRRGRPRETDVQSQKGKMDEEHKSKRGGPARFSEFWRTPPGVTRNLIPSLPPCLSPTMYRVQSNRVAIVFLDGSGWVEVVVVVVVVVVLDTTALSRSTGGRRLEPMVMEKSHPLGSVELYYLESLIQRCVNIPIPTSEGPEGNGYRITRPGRRGERRESRARPSCTESD
ncbi:hypothetical protein BO70DRAFT_138156 [Aspergillus heteromorphus CBS 117.55]|uniref:Uncharacterized protein n=1 Tax=Aspergillus heteromorphus CBS 117.55 TaxID=1448321 RepID=A0A317VBH8_9EURO|nr:uncharacterized protein BO70DRAFT_138156 [Aspergillus heteromorphus CBS 117.55]PWY70427.1 hypothetical protein BO70DRAFT_138156 [Aspergillus heteromorphus CBS 117.55]